MDPWMDAGISGWRILDREGGCWLGLLGISRRSVEVTSKLIKGRTHTYDITTYFLRDTPTASLPTSHAT